MGKTTLGPHDFAGKPFDESAARRFLETCRWNGAPVCPRCAAKERAHRQSRDGVDGYYRCAQCRTVFTVRSGTLLERSHVPLAKWLFAIKLMTSSRRQVSSVQLAHLLGVTQKTAWSMLQRLRPCLARVEDDDGQDNDFLRALIGSGAKEEK